MPLHRFLLSRIPGLTCRTIASALRPGPSQAAFGQIQTIRGAHGANKREGDKELVTFLADEIATETKGKKSTPLAKAIDGFTIATNKAEIKLSKTIDNEEIVLSMNVNHTVDTDPEHEEEARARAEKDQEQSAEMKSKPNFDIEIKRGNTTLSFSCTYLEADNPPDSNEEYSDVFVIDEVTLYEGECQEETYAVAGDILDGYLYDLFMNMLEERGITNEFAEKLSEFCTEYEHNLYVDLLRRLQTFYQAA